MTHLQCERERRGWSRNMLAELARLPRGRVGAFENARAVPPPESVELARLARVLAWPGEPAELLSAVDNPGNSHD